MRDLVALGELVQIARGTTYKSSLLDKPGPVLLGLGSISRNGGFRGDSLRTYGGESADKLLVRSGDLYVSLKDVTQSADLLGSVAQLPASVSLGRLTQDTVRLDIVSNRVDRDYLYRQLLSPEYRAYCRSHLTGTTNLGLPRDDFLAYPIWLPSMEEQRRIAGVLGSLDDLIDTNERLAAASAETRRTLIASAIAVAAVERPLSSVAQFVNGRNFTKGASGTGRPIIRTPEVRSGVSAATLRSEVDASPQNTASAGDILMVWSGSLLIGRWLGADALINQHIFKVIPAGYPDWIVYGLLERQLPWFMDLAAGKATTMGHIQRSHLDTLVPVPTEEEVDALRAAVQPLWDTELALALENAELRRTRDELLPLLMSGRVRVPDSEELIA